MPSVTLDSNLGIWKSHAKRTLASTYSTELDEILTEIAEFFSSNLPVVSSLGGYPRLEWTEDIRLDIDHSDPELIELTTRISKVEETLPFSFRRDLYEHILAALTHCPAE